MPREDVHECRNLIHFARSSAVERFCDQEAVWHAHVGSTILVLLEAR